MNNLYIILLLGIKVTNGLPSLSMKEKDNCKPLQENPPYLNPDLFEGDIIGIENPQDRNAIPRSEQKWPGGIIPYMIDPDIVEHKDLIEKAMNHYHMYTCIRFVPYTDQKDFVLIFQGRGCFSHVGRKGGIQTLSLGKGCHYFATAVHELGHTIGFYHEQSRSDRDDYLIIHWQNIQQNMKDQFQKLLPSQNLLLDKFDYRSIMLYGETVFSKDYRSKTMEAKKEGVRLKDLQDKDGLSVSDIVRVRKLYNCDN